MQKTLTVAERELQAIRRAKVKGPDGRRTEDANRAMEELLRMHRGLIFKISSRSLRIKTLAEMDDLEQAGRVGFMIAVERFDEGRGVRLTSYAGWWIRQSADREAAVHRIIRVPLRRRSMDPTAQKIERAKYVGSLDREDDDGKSQGVLRSLSYEPADPDDGGRARELLASKVRQVIMSFRGRARTVLSGRYLSEMTLAELAKRMGISKERVRQVQSRLKQELRARLERAGVTESTLSELE